MQKGFSIIEVLLAVTILGLMVTGLVGSIIYGQQSTALAGERVRANLLAEEGLEATRNIRDSSFGDLIDGNHGLAILANQWVFSGTSDAVAAFTRQVTISTPGTNRKQTGATMTWQQTPSQSGSVTLTTYHTNWRASKNGSGATCSVFCNSLGYTTGVCRGSPGVCTGSGETYEAGGDPQCTGGPSQDTCCCQP